MGKRIKRHWASLLAFALLAGGAGSAGADDPVDLGSPIILVDGTTITIATVFTPTDIDTDYGNETVTSTWSFNDIADRTWSPAQTFDIDFGDAVDEGQIRIGNLVLGQADDTVSGTVLDDTFIFYNASDSIENISYVFFDGSSSNPRFVIAEEGADLATYNPRSMVIGPAATVANMDENIICSTNFSNIDCNTATTGADLGVQDDLEIGGEFFLADCALTTPAANTLAITCNGVEVARFNTAGSGANFVDVTPAAAGSGPIIAAAGTDADIELRLDGKGTKGVRVTGDWVAFTVTKAPAIFNLPGTSLTVPVFRPNSDDGNTGYGAGNVDVLHEIVGGAIRVKTAIDALALQNDVLIQRDVNAGLTACTTQTQGQCPLTAEFNEIATVANINDVCGTLQPAVAGLKIVIINKGANDCQVFPASGDDIGAGVDAALMLPADHASVSVAYDSTNWFPTGEPGAPHGTMVDEDNTDVYVVNDAGADFHSYHTNALALGESHGWTFDAGGGGTSFPIASIADSVGSPGTQILVTTTGSHLLAAGDIISHTNLADAAYVGVFEVVVTAAATTYEVAAVFTATGTGTMDQAATMECLAGLSDDYHIVWHATATNATNNETFDFVLYRETTTIPGTKVRRKFGTASDFGSFSGGGVVAVTCGDKISLALSNEDSAGNITIRNLTMVATRL